MDDKPTQFPANQPNGAPLKPLTQVILDRRATTHFVSDEVPEEYLTAMLRFCAQSPSGYNLQPWRFIVVRDPENRRRLSQAAFNQRKIVEAPVVIIALGMKEQWKQRAPEVFREGAGRGAGDPAAVEKTVKRAIDFLSHHPMNAWVNRHVMIAVTTLMLLAEAYGFDTAPMEGFDPAAVKREFDVPDEAEVVALLAIGRAQLPDKAYPGRFPLDQTVFAERYGQSW